MVKTVLILRGLPGSGKTSLAYSLLDGMNSKRKKTKIVHFEIDTYLSRLDPNSCYIAQQRREAIRSCLVDFCEEILEGNNEFIIVSNHSLTKGDFSSYHAFAKEHGHKVFVMSMDNIEGFKPVTKEGVPLPVNPGSKLQHFN